MELTLKRGLSPLSPFAFAIYGVREISLGNVECAYQFGNLAMSLLNQTDRQEAVCPKNGVITDISLLLEGTDARADRSTL